LLGKKLAIDDISAHLMNDAWLDPFEFVKEGTINANLTKLQFPFSYPLLNHPSTIFLLKAPLGEVELQELE